LMNVSWFSTIRRASVRVPDLFFLLALSSCTMAASLSAQTEETATLQGRAINADTGRFVANAVVTVVGTNLRTVTDDYGRYRFDRVPVGDVRVRATYIGRDPQLRTVSLTAGETAT